MQDILLFIPLYLASCALKHLAFHPRRLPVFKNLHVSSYVFFFISSRIIAFLFPATGLPENCILSPKQRNHELAILPLLQLAIRSSLMLDVLEAVRRPLSALSLAAPPNVASGEGPAADTRDKEGLRSREEQ